MTSKLEDTREMLIDALEHLRAAVLLLDEAEAPAHIAAHVDLAVNQIDDVLGLGPRVFDSRRKAGPIGVP